MNPWEIRLLPDTLHSSVHRVPDQVALIQKDRQLTYQELWDSSVSLAQYMIDHGLSRGDRVLIWLENSLEFCIAVYAANLGDGVFVPINPETPLAKIQYLIEDCRPHLIVTQEKLATKLHGVLDALTSPPQVVLADHLFRELKLSRSCEQASLPRKNIPNDLAALIYTSGSTGEPKGVMLTHGSMVFSAGSLVQYLGLGAEHRILCPLPLSFDYGLYQVLMAMMVGASVDIPPDFKFPGSLIQSLDEGDVSVFPSIPTTFATLIQIHGRNPIQFPGVQIVTNTAAALSTKAIPVLQEIFPNAKIFKMYGLTECKRVSYLAPDLLDKYPGSVGKAIPGTEVFILDEGGQPVEEGAIGTLHVRGPHVMAGYWNKPEKSNRVLLPGHLPGEKVLKTGDLFRQGAEGVLFFMGRRDEMIKSRGQKVSTLEIERVLIELNGVGEVCVIGIPHEVLGHALRAFIVPDLNSPLTKPELLNHCKNRLESFQIPQDFIFVDNLPLSPNGKVDKEKLFQKEARN